MNYWSDGKMGQNYIPMLICNLKTCKHIQPSTSWENRGQQLHLYNIKKTYTWRDHAVLTCNVCSIAFGKFFNVQMGMDFSGGSCDDEYDSVMCGRTTC